MSDSDSSLFSPSPSPHRGSSGRPRQKSQRHSDTDQPKLRKLSNRNVAMKLFAKKYGGNDIFRRFADAWGADRMNPDRQNDRYDPEYTKQMMQAHGTVHTKTKRFASSDTDRKRAKRAPSAYNLFVKSFMEQHKSEYKRTEMMQAAAEAWRKEKGE